ncbi:MAG: formylglycine-generating enzyme family protein [Pirellulales bacterium]
MTNDRLAILAAALTGICLASSTPGEGPPAAGVHLCLVDGKHVEGNVYWDIAGVRLYACGEECLKQIKDAPGYARLIEKSGREPELIPIHQSRQPTGKEATEGMVVIEGGEFARSGSFSVRQNRVPEPVAHEGYRVRVGSFYLDKYEVTFADYCRFLEDGNERYRAGGISRDAKGKFVPPNPESARLPMRAVNYFQAKAYAQWAGKRLPTEAEWEFAHGGTEGRKYPWGNDEPGDTRANFGPKFKGLQPVGSFPEGQTPEGVFDLAGNIGEWLADYYVDGEYQKSPPGKLAADPQGPATGFLRVYRLGCQCRDATAAGLRGNLRCYATPFRAAPCVGFRCAKSL